MPDYDRPVSILPEPGVSYESRERTYVDPNRLLKTFRARAGQNRNGLVAAIRVNGVDDAVTGKIPDGDRLHVRPIGDLERIGPIAVPHLDHAETAVDGGEQAHSRLSRQGGDCRRRHTDGNIRPRPESDLTTNRSGE
jgi:hypothetical protein